MLEPNDILTASASTSTSTSTRLRLDFDFDFDFNFNFEDLAGTCDRKYTRRLRRRLDIEVPVLPRLTTPGGIVIGPSGSMPHAHGIMRDRVQDHGVMHVGQSDQQPRVTPWYNAYYSSCDSIGMGSEQTTVASSWDPRQDYSRHVGSTLCLAKGAGVSVGNAHAYCQGTEPLMLTNMVDKLARPIELAALGEDAASTRRGHV